MGICKSAAELKKEIWKRWDNYHGTPGSDVERAWSQAVSNEDVRKCLNARQGEESFELGRLFQRLEQFCDNYQERFDEEGTTERSRNPTTATEEIKTYVDAADSLRLKALVLHELLDSEMGVRVKRFRTSFTGGRVLLLSEVDRFIQDAISSEGAGIERANEDGICIDSEFYAPHECPSFVSASSCLGQAYGLARRLADRYDWRLEDAVLFLFTAVTPNMFPLRLRPNVSSWEEALSFSSVNTTPFTLKVMPWMSPAKVAKTLSKWQRTSWIGKTKSMSEAGLQRLIFVLSEQHKRQSTVLTKGERRVIFQEWQQNPNSANDEPSLGEDASRFFEEVERTLFLITGSSSEKHARRKNNLLD